VLLDSLHEEAIVGPKTLFGSHHSGWKAPVGYANFTKLLAGCCRYTNDFINVLCCWVFLVTLKSYTMYGRWWS